MTNEVKISAPKDFRVTVRRTTDGEKIESTSIDAGKTQAIQFDPTTKNAFTIEADTDTQVEDPRIVSDLSSKDYAAAPAPADDAPATPVYGMGEPMPIDKGTITAEEPEGAAKAQPKAKTRK